MTSYHLLISPLVLRANGRRTDRAETSGELLRNVSGNWVRAGWMRLPVSLLRSRRTARRKLRRVVSIYRLCQSRGASFKTNDFRNWFRQKNTRIVWRNALFPVTQREILRPYMQTTPDLCKQHLLTTPRKLAQATTPVTCSLDVLDLIYDGATNYPQIFRVSPQSLQRLYLAYDSFLPHSLFSIMDSFEAVESELVTNKTNKLGGL